MPNMTLAIPEELYKIMRKHQEVKWSHVAREALWRHANMLENLERLDKLTAGNKMTEEEVEKFSIEMGRKINRAAAKRLGLIGSSSTPIGSSQQSSLRARRAASSSAKGSNSSLPT